jgi:hypothetical protein
VLIFISKETLQNINATLSEFNRRFYGLFMVDFETKDKVVIEEELIEKNKMNSTHA